MKRAEDGELIFETTGRKVHFFGTLSPGVPREIYYGSAVAFRVDPPLTDDELSEIAEYMIAGWRRWLQNSLARAAA